MKEAEMRAITRSAAVRAFMAVVVVTLTTFSGVSVLASGRTQPEQLGPAPLAALNADPSPPERTVKLIFVHHSTGEAWLGDGHGGLGTALRDQGYYVSDTNYGWGPDSIGDRTDLGHWWEWFAGPRRDTFTAALFSESSQHCDYSRLGADPGGENEIVLFKSCFPNSLLAGNPSDPPRTGENPLRGQDSYSGHMTVANAKGIYNDLLSYFASRQDKLFVAITAPPLTPNETDAESAANARAFNNWLVNDWLASYPHPNVAVFDFYTVLTSNGGNANANDLGQESGNHHRWWNGTIDHRQTVANNNSSYGSGDWDSHPTAAGDRKATGEFLPLLNIYHHAWRSDGGSTAPTNTASLGTPTSTRSLAPASATLSPMPSLTQAPSTGLGEQVLVFQQGVAPSSSYSGASDAIIAGDASPNANLGGTENIELFWGDQENRRSLLRFDLSAIPSGVYVSRATLELYRYDGDAEGEMEAALYRATKSWAEGSGYDLFPDTSYVPDGATWAAASTGAPWTTPGGDHDTSSDYGQGPNGKLGETTLARDLDDAWIALDATSAVRGWVQGEYPNDGLLLRALSGEYIYHYFASREYPTASLRPRLVVTYTAAGPTMTATSRPEPTETSRPTATSTQRPQPTETSRPQATSTNVSQLRLPLIMKGVRRIPEPTRTIDPSATQTPTTNPSAKLDVRLAVTNTLGVARLDEPVTSGVPLPQASDLRDPSVLRLLDGAGVAVPCQFTATARWGGGPDDATKPIRWLLLDFQASVPAHDVATYRLVDSGGPEPAFPALTVTSAGDGVSVDTGVATFRLDTSSGDLDAPRLRVPLYGRATDQGGSAYTTTGPATVTVGTSGPMRASVTVHGSYRDPTGLPLIEYTSRYWFYAGQPYVRLFHTVENNTPAPLAEYDQLTCFYIGSPASVAVTDVSLILATELGSGLAAQVGGEGTPIEEGVAGDLLLYQDSSGTEHWDAYAEMTDWDGHPLDARPRMQAYVRSRGYQTTLGATVVDSGDHAPGWLRVAGALGSWSLGVRDYWQNYPKALRVSPNGTLQVGLFPDEYGPAGYGFNLRSGEHKTHELLLAPDSSWTETASATPLFATAGPDWYVNSAALPFLSPRDWEDWPEYEGYVNYQLDTAPTYEEWMDWYPNLPTAIEASGFYGIFDYGDLPIDYEGYGIAPLNIKYQIDYGMWMHWLRGADPRWLELATAADRHVADIDIVHTLHSPRHWGDGIMFGHSAHDEDGFTNPHRNINSGSPDTAFGVPGLLLTYYLTGYEKAYSAALELADCVTWRLANDTYLCDFYTSGTCDGEGWVLFADGLYAANTRPAANSLEIAIQAYRATGDSRYLTVADALVDWARADDQPYISGPTGEAEQMRPWMLNTYLLALADYMETRNEFGLPDTYGAEASYIAYAEWLHTYPWLELTAIDTGARAAYPYEWWFDGRTGIDGEDNDNGDASVNNWLLLGADAMAYAHRLSGSAQYLEWAERLFRTGSRDPFFEGDANTYSFTKETANGLAYGHLFMSEWARR